MRAEVARAAVGGDARRVLRRSGRRRLEEEEEEEEEEESAKEDWIANCHRTRMRSSRGKCRPNIYSTPTRLRLRLRLRSTPPSPPSIVHRPLRRPPHTHSQTTVRLGWLSMSSPADVRPSRRRSHSASSPVRGAYSSDDRKCRFSTKRARPSNPQSPSYHTLASDQPPEKWDVDQWRRGKRARTDAAEHSDLSEQHSPFPSLPLPQDAPISASQPFASRLPHTSDAFHLFPTRTRVRRLSRRSMQRHGPTSIVDDECTTNDLYRMRSHAFGELRRSVVEGGEGLVQRMRDWETSRSDRPGSERSWGYGRRSCKPGRRFAHPTHGWAADVDTVGFEDHDEDDIVIVSNASSGSSHHNLRSPSYKKRALSLGMMDVDAPEIDVHPPYEDSERCSSPIDISSGPSACSSDDEESFQVDSDGIPYPGSSPTPALSQTFTNSANSSLLSLPLPQSLSTLGDQSTPFATAFTFSHSGTQPAQPSHGTTTRSEKTLAALTLAMANGAGGLNDYNALHVAEDTSAIDECEVGEMWH